MNLIIKLSALALVSLLSHHSFGQFAVEKERKSYLGVTAGVNFSLPNVTDRYAVLNSPGSADDKDFQKEYGKFGENLGTQFGIHFSYNFTNSISIVTGFGYQTNAFNYRTQYSWSDTAQNQNVEREMHHLQKISYLTLPVMAKWDLTKGQFKPYLQAGVYVGYRHQASKVIHYDNVIDGEETENQITSTDIVPISDNIQKFNMGVMGGVGISYYTKYFTLGLETNFKYGLFNVVNDENRYADFNGFALKYLDVLDQFKLSSLNLDFSISVPLGNSVFTKLRRKDRFNSYY